jgi:hypothetical protein
VRGVWGGIAIACLIACPAAAEVSADTGRDTSAAAKVLLFSGTDFWRDNAFIHGGLMWSPGDFNHGGFTLKLLIGGGTYGYYSGALETEITGRQFIASAMAGWRFKIDDLEATFFVGPDWQDHKLTPDDATGRLRGSYLGVRAGADIWYEPQPGFMVAVNASAANPTKDYSLRGAIGWRVLDRLYLGPEAEVQGSADYQQLRIGLHVTGLKLGWFEWSAGGGFAEDSDHRSGGYGRLGVLTRY